MTATIIQTNEKPLQSVDVDGVTVDLIENALRNAREEMDAVLFRTAMSPGIREQGDCFPMIANVMFCTMITDIIVVSQNHTSVVIPTRPRP